MDKITPNSTQVPNILIDFLFPNIPDAEMKCLLYICRRTFGFRRSSDRISYSQFINGIKTREGRVLDLGTGLSRQSVNIALRSLDFSGAIKVNKQGRTNLYAINLEMDVKSVVSKIDQSRKLTKKDQISRPKQGKLFDLQKKGKKEKIDFSNQEGGQKGDNFNPERRQKVLADMRKSLSKRFTV